MLAPKARRRALRICARIWIWGSGFSATNKQGRQKQYGIIYLDSPVIVDICGLHTPDILNSLFRPEQPAEDSRWVTKVRGCPVAVTGNGISIFRRLVIEHGTVDISPNEMWLKNFKMTRQEYMAVCFRRNSLACISAKGRLDNQGPTNVITKSTLAHSVPCFTGTGIIEHQVGNVATNQVSGPRLGKAPQVEPEICAWGIRTMKDLY